MQIPKRPTCAPDEIFALALHPKWAALVRDGVKSIETRTWRTHHRGELLITATAAGGGAGLPAGVAVCLVEVADCRPMRHEDAAAACVAFAPGLFAWELVGVRAVAAIQVRGRLKLFRVPRALVAPGRSGRQPAGESLE